MGRKWYGTARLPQFHLRKFVIRRWDGEKGRKREARVRSHAYFRLTLILALRATRCACVAHAGGSKYPDIYVIVTREEDVRLHRGDSGVFDPRSIRLVCLSWKSVCVRNAARLIFKCLVCSRTDERRTSKQPQEDPCSSVSVKCKFCICAVTIGAR